MATISKRLKDREGNIILYIFHVNTTFSNLRLNSLDYNNTDEILKAKISYNAEKTKYFYNENSINKYKRKIKLLKIENKRYEN